MSHDLNPSPAGDFGSLAINDLLPERPALIGEFSPAYEAFREATIADLAPVTRYEYLQALQLTDLNWAILQAKASAEAELSTATERTVRAQLNAKLEGDGEREYDRLLLAFEEAGGASTGTTLSRTLRASWRALSRWTQASGRPLRLRQSSSASTRGSS